MEANTYNFIDLVCRIVFDSIAHFLRIEDQGLILSGRSVG